MKRGSRSACEHCDGVLEGRALLPHQIELRGCGIEQCLLLRQVESGGQSAFVAVVDELQALRLNVMESCTT